jgi:hypothetical protein
VNSNLILVMAMYLRALERVSIPADSAQISCLLSLEEQDCAVTQVEIDEVFGLCKVVSAILAESAHRYLEIAPTVCDEAAKVSADNAMPCCALPLIELNLVSTGRRQMLVF